MTKLKVALKLKDKTGLTRRQSIEIVDHFLQTIKTSLKEEEPVRIMKLGSFYVKNKKPRKSRNPRTGEQVFVPAKKVATFRSGKALLDIVNGNMGEAIPEVPSTPEPFDPGPVDSGSSTPPPVF